MFFLAIFALPYSHTTMKDINQNIMLLRALVEESANHRLSTSTDFAFLSGCIQGRLHQTLSVSTLERIWGYVDGYQSVREGTLSILAQFVGFPDWATFVADYCNVPSAQSSHRVMAPSLMASEVPTGDRIVIEWNPERKCTLVHLGDGLWRVEESIKSKLLVGDTFLCQRFTLNQPLFLEDYHHENEPPSLFVVGKRGGLTRVELI